MKKDLEKIRECSKTGENYSQNLLIYLFHSMNIKKQCSFALFVPIITPKFRFLKSSQIRLKMFEKKVCSNQSKYAIQGILGRTNFKNSYFVPKFREISSGFREVTNEFVQSV